MFSVCRIGTALLATLLPTLALAQVIPPSELPGRTGERFVEPPAARAQRRGPVVTLPGTVAPQEAEIIVLTIRGVRITGMTVYRDEELAFRAYDPSELVGDNCFMALGELRLDMPMPKNLFSLAQLYAFADHGRLTNIRPVLGTPDAVDASSAGAGIRFGWNNQVFTDFHVAKAIEGPRDDTRAFAVITARN